MVGFLIACMLALCTLIGDHVVEPEVAGHCIEVDCCEGEEEATTAVTLPAPTRSVKRLRFVESVAVADHHEHELLRPPEA